MDIEQNQNSAMMASAPFAHSKTIQERGANRLNGTEKQETKSRNCHGNNQEPRQQAQAEKREKTSKQSASSAQG